MEFQNRYSSLGPGFEFEKPPKSKRFSIPVLLFLAFCILLSGFSMELFPKSFSEYKIYTEAEERTKSGETEAALSDLFSVQKVHPNSLPVTLRLIDLSMASGYYDLAAYVFNEYLTGKELGDSQYARMMRYSRCLDSYYLTCEAVDELFGQLETEGIDGELSEEEQELNIRRLREGLQKLHQDQNQYPAVLYYYEAMVCEDRETQYDYLQSAYEEDPELYDVRVLLGNAERTRGNMALAHEYLEAAIQKEAQDAGALRGLAVLAMLEDDPKEALLKARQAYESDPDSLYVRETYLIALHINGQESGKQEMIAEIQELNGSLEEDTRQLLDGRITLEDYYMGG